jgi:hypothetical protein
MIVVRVKVSKGIVPLSLMGIDSAGTNCAAQVCTLLAGFLGLFSTVFVFPAFARFHPRGAGSQ